MKTKIRAISAITAVIIVFGLASLGLSQTASTGALTGTTTDATRAVIPGVGVTLTNEATREVRTAVSGENGNYSFPQLSPNTYRLEAALPGFKTAVRSGVRITVTETTRLDIQLEVGAVAETVTVEAAPEMVQRESSALGRVLGQQAVVSLPLVSRNFTQILALSPGITTDVTNAGEIGRGSGGISIGKTTVNGSRTSDHNYQIDGLDANDFQQSGGGLTPGAPVPNPDTIQEFKAQTGLADASFGRNAGASVNIITKSGTNDFHGTLFEFFRNEALNANDFFFNLAGQRKPVVRQNQYGGTFGGAIKKDKLFFFTSYQGTKQYNALVAGKLKVSCSASITGPPLTDDRSAAALGGLFAGQSGQNGGVAIKADGSNINPVALRILNLKSPDGPGYLFPTPQVIDRSQPFARQGFSVTRKPCSFGEDQGMMNLDFLQTEKSKFVARGFYATSKQTATFGDATANVPGFPQYSNTRFLVASLAHNYVFGPNVFNEVRGGVTRTFNGPYFSAPFKWSDVGVFAPVQDTDPGILITGSYRATVGTMINYPQWVYQVSDNLSYIVGKHTLRFGGGVMRLGLDLNGQGGASALTFLSFPDFLLGLSGAQNGTQFSNINASSYGYANERFNTMRLWDGNAYIQDDIKVSSRLTLNVGLRYERLGDVSDPLGNAATFDPYRANPDPPASGTFQGFIITGGHFCCEAQFPNSKGIPPGSIRSKTKVTIDGQGQNNLAPRFGLSWQILPDSNRLVLRGGYGMYYSHISGDAGPLNLDNAIRGSGSQGLSGVNAVNFTLENPFVPLPPNRTVCGGGTWKSCQNKIVWSRDPYSPTTNQSMGGMEMSYRPPVTHQYGLNIQSELAQNLLMEVGYVGSRGLHMISSTPTNSAMLASPSNPIRGVTTNTVANARLRVPILGFTPMGIDLVGNSGAFWYNGLQASLTKRMSRGLQMMASYTFARTMDLDGNRAFLTYAGAKGIHLGDPAAGKKQAYGRSETGRDHRFVLSYVYQLPGLGASDSFIRKVAGGWVLSGVTVLQSGTPMTISYTNTNNVRGKTTDRASLKAGCTYADLGTSGRTQDRLKQYFNTSCITTPAVVGDDGRATGFGNMGVSIIDGPGQRNTDISIVKTIPLGFENKSLEFRSEFFNLFNTANFSNPATDFNSSDFGRISTTAVNPRFVQLALKFIF